MEIESLLAVLRECWSRETSSVWSLENPARGQCSVTSLVIQDRFGGEILKTRVGEQWHFYNLVGGVRRDFTADRFPAPVTYDDLSASREEALADTSAQQYASLSVRFSARIGTFGSDMNRGSK